jgi:Protein of unknown function (DUF2478)
MRALGEGRGFRPVIAEALSNKIPVIVGINALNLPVFLDFSGGLGTGLPSDSTSLADWVAGLGPNCVHAA